MQTVTISFFVLLLSLHGLGCQGSKESTPNSPGQKAQNLKPSEKPYTIEIEKSPIYKEKNVEKFKISLGSKGDWHINEEYPIRLVVESQEGLELPKEEFGKSEASVFSENRVTFEIPFSASSSGKYSINADFSFAVCTKEHCMPDKKHLKTEIEVSPTNLKN